MVKCHRKIWRWICENGFELLWITEIRKAENWKALPRMDSWVRKFEYENIEWRMWNIYRFSECDKAVVNN